MENSNSPDSETPERIGEIIGRIELVKRRNKSAFKFIN